MQISIAGAGIGGLAAAALLGAQGHVVTVYDQFDQPRPVGSGLVIQPVGQMVLKAAGALDMALAMGAPLRRMLGHEATGRRVLDVFYDRGNTGRHGLAIHRAALFEALLQAALASGAKLVAATGISGRDGQSLTLSDGSQTAPADLLIDAMGAHSPLSPLKSRPLVCFPCGIFRRELLHSRWDGHPTWKLDLGRRPLG